MYTCNSVWAVGRGDLPSDRDLLPYAFDKMSSARRGYTIDSSRVRIISADIMHASLIKTTPPVMDSFKLIYTRRN